MGIGERIKQALSDKGMTIKGLSEKSEVPINTLYSITKRDSNNVRDETLAKIATVLGVDINYLRYGLKAKQLSPGDTGWIDTKENTQVRETAHFLIDEFLPMFANVEDVDKNEILELLADVIILPDDDRKSLVDYLKFLQSKRQKDGDPNAET